MGVIFAETRCGLTRLTLVDFMQEKLICCIKSMPVANGVN